MTEKLREVLAARDKLGEDFFGGWEPSDIELFAKYAVQSEPEPGKITDFLGIRTSIQFLPEPCAWFAGNVHSDLPIPNDGVHAEAIEYFALLDSLERANGSFSLVELGAAYAPWACTAAVLCRKRGIAFQIGAVEASRFLFAFIAMHLADNNIDPAAPNVRLINAAVAISRSQSLYFPQVPSSNHNGAAVHPHGSAGHERTPVCELSDAIPECGCDLLHIDIQGTEAELIAANRSLLREKVDAIFIGTHGRRVECNLYAMLADDGWTLIRERICRHPTRDGAQYWRNPKRGPLADIGRGWHARNVLLSRCVRIAAKLFRIN